MGYLLDINVWDCSRAGSRTPGRVSIGIGYRAAYAKFEGKVDE